MLQEKEVHQIVIIDDDPLILKAFKRQFQDDFDVQTFPSGADVLIALDHLCPSLFIIDWMMPGMDGITLTENIRSNSRFHLVPIAFHTAVDQTKERMTEAFEAGAQAFISKEGSFAMTLIQIRTLIDNYKKLLSYLEQQKIMLSVLKHDMASLLTGVDGLDVLGMDAVFQSGDLREQMDSILDSSDRLRLLFDDLSEVLVVGGGQQKVPLEQVGLGEIFVDLRGYLKMIPREVRCTGQEDLPVFCRKRGLGRCLYYLVRLFDGHLANGVPVDIEVENAPEGISFRLRAVGNFSKGFDAFSSETVACLDPNLRRDILFAQYVKNVLNSHNATLARQIGDDETVVTFFLPGPAKREGL